MCWKQFTSFPLAQANIRTRALTSSQHSRFTPQPVALAFESYFRWGRMSIRVRVERENNLSVLWCGGKRTFGMGRQSVNTAESSLILRRNTPIHRQSGVRVCVDREKERERSLPSLSLNSSHFGLTGLEEILLPCSG